MSKKIKIETKKELKPFDSGIDKKEESKTETVRLNKELDIGKIRLLLDTVEDDIQKLKELILLSEIKNRNNNLLTSKDSRIIEGIFDGESMIDKNNKKHQVTQNYASKSKLVAGDLLKLTVASDGTFVYKQIGPIERKKIIGIVGKSNNRYFVTSEGKKYNILLASVTYFQLEVRDKVTIIVPRDKESSWAAVENVIEKGK